MANRAPEDRLVVRPSVSGDAKEVARNNIVQAAALAFMSKGFSGTSIDDIADLLAATKGRVYHYYRSKADLFLDVHLTAMNLMLEGVAPIARTDEPPPVRLWKMAREHARLLMTHLPLQRVAVQGLQRFITAGMAERQELALDRIFGLRDEYEGLFADVIEEGLQAGQFRRVDARFATKPLLGALNWLTIWFDPERDVSQERIDGIAEDLADFVLSGLGHGDTLSSFGAP